LQYIPYQITDLMPIANRVNMDFKAV
jgi:hypothetical protein